MKIAMIGTGIIANSHLEVMKNIEDLTLVGVCDINEDAAKKYAADYDVPYWTDYKAMAEETEFDAVILNLPHFLHCEASVFFLKKGIHVLCEKPMANTLEECDAMLAAAEEGDAKLAIGHIQRFSNAHEKVKEYIDNKYLGELCMVSETRNANYFSDKRPKWFLDRKLSGGGILMNFGAHSLDKLSFMVGNDFSDVSGSCGNFLGNCNVEGHAQVRLTINGKVSASINLCGYNAPGIYENIFYFTGGALKIIGTNSLYISDTPGGAFREIEIEASMPPFENQLREFIKFVNNEESNIADGVYSRKIIEVITKVYSQNI